MDGALVRYECQNCQPFNLLGLQPSEYLKKKTFFRLPLETLSELGLLTRWCAFTLGTALLCSSRAGSDLMLIWLHGLDSSSINWVSVVGLWIGRIGVGGDPFYKVEFVSSDNMMKYFFSSCQYFTVTTVGYTSVKITPILQR